jgi:hypothetical protein
MPMNNRLLIPRDVATSPPAPPTFTPASITDLAVWLDASDPFTLLASTTGGSPASVNGEVARWADKSSNALEAIQETAGTRPVRKAAVQNGLGTLRFDGTNDTLQIPSVTLQSHCTVFVVSSTNAPFSTSTRLYLEHGPQTNSNPGMFFIGTDTTAWAINRGSLHNGPNRLLDWMGDGWGIAGFRYDGNNGPLAGVVYKNGGLVADDTSNATTAQPNTPLTTFLNIAARRASLVSAPSLLLSGDIGEIVIYNRPLTLAERQQVEGYLAAKWGLRHLLPVSHPNFSGTPAVPVMAGLTNWWDYSDTTSQTARLGTSGFTGMVDHLRDKVTGNHAFSTLATIRPIAVNAWLGGPIAAEHAAAKTSSLLIALNGGSRTVPSEQSQTFFAVYRRIRSTVRSIPLGQSATANRNYSVFWDVDGQTYHHSIGQGGDVVSEWAAFSPSDTRTGWFVDAVVRTADTSITLHRNGTQVGATYTNTAAALRTASGGWNILGGAGTTRHSGLLAEVLVYNRALSSTERQQVENYLTNKWITPGNSSTSWRNVGPTHWPSYASSIQQTVASTTVSSTLTTPTGTYGTAGSNLFAGGVLLPDGRVFCVPYNSDTARIYEPATNSLATPTGTYGTVGGNSFIGGVLLPDGRVFCVPYSSTQARIYDPESDTLSVPAGSYNGSASFAGGVLLPDGRVFCVPHNSDTARIYDPATNVLTTPPGTYGPVGGGSFIGGVLLPDGKVFCVPYNSTQARIYDYILNETTTPVGTYDGGASFIGGILLPDGRVFCVPINSATARIYNPATNSLATPTGTYGTVGGNSFIGGVLLPDGRVFCVPYSSTQARIYDPILNDTTTPAATFPGGAAFNGGVLLADGRVFCVPYSSATSRIYGGGGGFNVNVSLSAYYNKF